MSTASWSDLAERLDGALSLATPPLAITFAAEVPDGVRTFDEPMPPPLPDGRTGRVPAGCVFWIKAAERTFATVAEDHANCSVGSMTHGFKTFDEHYSKDEPQKPPIVLIMWYDSEKLMRAIDDKMAKVGCSARIVEVLKKHPDGRMDIMTEGVRRFELDIVHEDRAFLQGSVEYFDDEAFDPIPPGVKERVIEGYNDLCQIDPPESLLDPELADPQLSFQLAQALSDLNFRQMLLATRSESERMKRLAEFLPSFNSRQRHISHVKAVAPQNGHGKWPPTL